MALSPRQMHGMFGNVAACRHVLGEHRGEWMAALCGTCTAVRDGSGQMSRMLVSTDAVAGSVLVRELGFADDAERRVGPCPARGMRSAVVWDGAAAAIGASVSLLAAAIVLDDKAADRDLPLGRVTSRPARRWSARLLTDAQGLARETGLATAPVVASLEGSRVVERLRPSDLGEWCAPVEDAYAAVFEVCGLADLGRKVGRVTLLADAVGDRDDDAASGAPNPILSGACTTEEAVALVRADVAAVGAEVTEMLPGSLSAVLWGRAWSTGVEKAMAPVTGGAPKKACSSRHGSGEHGQDEERDGRLGLIRFTGAVAGLTAALSLNHPDQQKKDRTWCCDACDCDCCDCDCCDCDCCCDC